MNCRFNLEIMNREIASIVPSTVVPIGKTKN